METIFSSFDAVQSFVIILDLLSRCFATIDNDSTIQRTQSQANSGYYRTPNKHSVMHQKQVQYDDSFLRQICLLTE